jgi:membrane glycosyltransferase
VFFTSGLLLSLLVVWFSGGLFRGPADLLTSALCALFLLLAPFAAFAWVLRVFGFIVSNAHPPTESEAPGFPTTRTAIVMPIYNEDVERVALGIERTWLSVKANGLDNVCDFFLLSDTTDENIRAGEQRESVRLLRHFEYNRGNSGRLFLVRRMGRGGYKAGNIENFLRIHGTDYEFMLVLDADSVMTGERIRSLIRKLELRPRTALIQSHMSIFRGRTLFARIMQSSQNSQSVLYSSGLRWLLDAEGIYWGHNAIIRIRPFAEHAMLPTYPWPPPQGGPVLSQDVHEASLLGRAGWGVDLDLDEGGSFEEMPANVISNAERDRRWCQGDFLNLTLLFSGEIKAGQRLWLFYIFIGYFLSLPVVGIMLLGSIDACRRSTEMGIEAGALALLNIYLLQLVPKGLAFVRPHFRKGLTHYGGGTFALDTIGGIILGPLMLYLHGRIILSLLRGQARPWKSPSRNPDDPLSWAQAAAVFWPATIVGVAWLGILTVGAPTYLFCCGPVMVVWALSIPMAVLTSQVGLADWLAKRGWMRARFTPDEEQMLGPLALDADRTESQHPVKVEVVELNLENPIWLFKPPAVAEIKVGSTKLHIPAIGTGSTRPAEVTQGVISAQRLMLLIGMGGVVLVATARYVIGR